MRKSKYELLIFWVQVWGDGIHPIFQKLNQIKWLSNELNSQFYWFTQWNYAIHSSHIIQVIQLKTGYSCTLMSWFCCSENSVLSDGKPFSSSIFLKIVHDCVFSWKLQALVHQAWKACRHRIIGEVMDLIFTCCVCWLASFICWICRFSFKYKPWSCSQQIVELFFWNYLCTLTFFMCLVTKFIVKEKNLMVFGTSSWENITETVAWSYSLTHSAL